MNSLALRVGSLDDPATWILGLVIVLAVVAILSLLRKR